MLKAKIGRQVLLIIVTSVISNAFALTYSGVVTINDFNKFGFDFLDQVACTTNGSYKGCYTNFYIIGSTIATGLVSNNGYGAKMGQVNLYFLKSAPADSIFAKSPSTIDDIPFDSLPFRVGNSYWIKTGPDAENNIIYYAKIRILSFPIMDSVKPETAMTFLYCFKCCRTKPTCVTSGLDTFHLPYYPTGVLPPEASSSHKTAAYFASGQLVFKVVGDRFFLPKDLEGINGYLSVFSLAGRKLERIAFDGKARDISWAGSGGRQTGRW